MKMILKPIRLNWHYVIWYRNFTALIVSLVVPFVLLAYWNFNTFSVIRRRRRLRNRPYLPSNNNSGQGDGSVNSENPNQLTPQRANVVLNSGNLAAKPRHPSTSEQGITKQ